MASTKSARSAANPRTPETARAGRAGSAPPRAAAAKDKPAAKAGAKGVSQPGARSAGNRPLFSPVTDARPADGIQRQIRALLADSRIGAGDRLPSERQLAEEFAVSRNSVRQALRSLADSGLLEIRKGAAGGAFVRADGGGAVGSLFNDLYSVGTIRPAHLTQVRVLLSVEMVRLACQFGTEAEFDDLERNVEEAYLAARTEDYAVRTRLNLDFYRIIARMTRNPLFEILIDALMTITGEVLLRYVRISNAVLMPYRRKLLRLLRARDEAAATALVREHLLRLQKIVLADFESRQPGRG